MIKLSLIMMIAKALINRPESCCCLLVLTCPYILCLFPERRQIVFQKTIKRFNISLFDYGTVMNNSNYSQTGGNSNFACLGGRVANIKFGQIILFTATEHNIHNTFEIITGQLVKIHTYLFG